MRIPKQINNITRLTVLSKKFTGRSVSRNETIRRIKLSPAHRAGTPLVSIENHNGSRNQGTNLERWNLKRSTAEKLDQKNKPKAIRTIHFIYLKSTVYIKPRSLGFTSALGFTAIPPTQAHLLKRSSRVLSQSHTSSRVLSDSDGAIPPSSRGWSAFMEDGKVKVLNVENVPSESKVSGGEKLRPSKKHNQKMEQNIQGLKTRERPTIFPFLQINGGSSDYIISRAILSTKNENVDEINDQLIDRLICKCFQMNVIDAEITVGHHAGKRVFLPRIPLCPSADDMFPFKLKRKQFPIRLSFAMTINKAQGQTILNVGVYLPESVFSHGQLYVALSRGISRENTKVLVKPVKEFTNEGVYTSNVVYREVLHDI
ncbi:hypothetical protein LXL04_015911 [Taraxacum kok-saghyz]